MVAPKATTHTRATQQLQKNLFWVSRLERPQITPPCHPPVLPPASTSNSPGAADLISGVSTRRRRAQALAQPLAQAAAVGLGWHSQGSWGTPGCGGPAWHPPELGTRALMEPSRAEHPPGSDRELGTRADEKGTELLPSPSSSFLLSRTESQGRQSLPLPPTPR